MAAMKPSGHSQFSECQLVSNEDEVAAESAERAFNLVAHSDADCTLVAKPTKPTTCVAARKAGRRLVPWVVMGGLLLSMAAHAAGGITSGKIKGAMYPVFIGTNRMYSAVIRIQELRPDSRRMGFFRIGVMPICLGVGVQVRLSNAQDALEVLNRIQALLKPLADQRAIEFQRFEIYLPSENTPSLVAKRVCCDERGSWRLSDGITVRTGDQTVRANSGTLHLAGPAAGRVVLAINQGQQELQLLPLNSLPADRAPSVSVKLQPLTTP